LFAISSDWVPPQLVGRYLEVLMSLLIISSCVQEAGWSSPDRLWHGDCLSDPPGGIGGKSIPRWYSNLSTAFINPIFPSWIRSGTGGPDLDISSRAYDKTQIRFHKLLFAISAFLAPVWITTMAFFSAVTERPVSWALLLNRRLASWMICSEDLNFPRISAFFWLPAPRFWRTCASSPSSSN